MKNDDQYRIAIPIYIHLINIEVFISYLLAICFSSINFLIVPVDYNNYFPKQYSNTCIVLFYIFTSLKPWNLGLNKGGSRNISLFILKKKKKANSSNTIYGLNNQHNDLNCCFHNIKYYLMPGKYLNKKLHCWPIFSLPCVVRNTNNLQKKQHVQRPRGISNVLWKIRNFQCGCNFKFRKKITNIIRKSITKSMKKKKT